MKNEQIGNFPGGQTQRSLWILLGSLYTTQSLALMFFIVAFVAILRERGASLDQIGLVYMLGMVWPFKFLWAPWVDSYSCTRHGHYRFWLLLMQAGMVCMLVGMSGFDPLRDFVWIYVLCLVVALLSATQDIAVDGLVCRMLPVHERGLANGLQIAGNLLGTLLGAGVVLMCYQWLGWMGSMWLLAAVTAVSWVQLLIFREPSWKIQATDITANVRRFWTFWREPGRMYWLAVLILYPVGSSLGYALIAPLLIDQGWSLEKVGFALNVVGPAAGGVAAVGTGGAVRRLGRRKAMIGAAILQLVSVVAIVPLVLDVKGAWLVMVLVAVYYGCYNPASVVLATLMMDEASRSSPATDYALQFSVNQFFAFGMVSLGAVIAQRLGYQGVLWVAAVAGVLAIALSMRFRPETADSALHPGAGVGSL